MDHSLESYQYRPLLSPSYIRVLQAKLKRLDNGISTQIIEVDLDGASGPAYHCLSYTWGNAIPTKSQRDRRQCSGSLILNTSEHGVTRTFTMLISQNLHDFLCQFCSSSPSEVEYLWIDTIYIHQADLRERANQINMMARIYSQCKATIAWLGRADNGSAVACALLVEYDLIPDARYTEAEFNKFKGKRGSLLGQWPSAPQRERLGKGEYPIDTWISFANLLNRNYFHRTWTLQELILPPQSTFWCGDTRFRLRPFFWILSFFNEFVDGHVKSLESVVSEANLSFPGRILSSRKTLRNTFFRATVHQELGDQLSPVTAVSFARHRQCTDPGDHVYEILGICDLTVAIDYEKSVADVFLDFVNASGLGAFVPYEVEWRKDRCLANLPSWIPDFTTSHGSASMVNMGGHNRFSAGGERGLVPLRSTNHYVLAVPGMFIDVINDIGGQSIDMQSGKTFIDSLKIISETQNLACRDDTMELFWRALVTDTWGSQPLPAESWGPSFAAMLKTRPAVWLTHVGQESNEAAGLEIIIWGLVWRISTGLLPSFSEISELSCRFASNRVDDKPELIDLASRSKLYEGRFWSRFDGYCFFVTSNGRMGIGPGDLKPGILVCIAKGCDYPLFLQCTNSSRFVLVGHGYVCGVMDGEALRGRAQLTRIEIE